MSEHDDAIWKAAATAYRCCEGEAEEEPLGAALDAVFAPENHSALIAKLIAEGAAGVMLDALTANGNLVHAGVWDPAPTIYGPDDELTLEALTDGRTTVYYEDEDRPDDAVPLFRVVREPKP